jgi:intein-encoded DNA endonuclease-like protein
METQAYKLEHNEIINLYLSGSSILYISKLYNCGQNTVSNILKFNNVEIRSGFKNKNARIHTLNENYFHNIDTAEKAYWLGFLSADGHLVENTAITVNLKESDKNHLEKLAKALESSVKPKLREKTKSYNINFCSKILTQDLFHLGFTHNKSQTQFFPNIDSKYYKDFIRGILDGDGSIQNYIRNRTHKPSKYSESYEQHEIIVTFSGTLSMMESISGIIDSQLNLYKRKVYVKSKSGFSEIKYSGGNQCKAILHWLYDDNLISLDRKQQKVKEILNEDISVNCIRRKKTPK